MTNHDDQMPLPGFDAIEPSHASFRTSPAASTDRREPIGGTPPYSYSASPAGIVAVDNLTGLVVARAEGTATVTARDSAVPLPATASYKVIVTAPTPTIIAPVPIWLPPYDNSMNAATISSGFITVQNIPGYAGYAPGHSTILETKYRALSDGEERSALSVRVAANPQGSDRQVDGARLKQTYISLGAQAITTRVRLYFSPSTPDSTPDMLGQWSAACMLLSW